MKSNKPTKIKIIFRKDKKDNTITAFFPEEPECIGCISCYQHIGQHGTANINYYHETKKATPEEYQELLKELESIYDSYKLVIRQRINYEKLVKAWRS